jgi:hypothetical protein
MSRDDRRRRSISRCTHHGSQPREQPAPAVEVDEQRSRLSIRPREPVQLGVQRISQLAAFVARDGSGGRIERGPHFTHQVLPRGVVPRAARARQRQVRHVERRQVQFSSDVDGVESNRWAMLRPSASASASPLTPQAAPPLTACSLAIVA